MIRKFCGIVSKTNCNGLHRDLFAKLITMLRSFHIILILSFLFAFKNNLIANDDSQLVIPPAAKITLEIPESGPASNLTLLPEEDSSVFFLNSTNTDIITLEVFFGDSKQHCWTPNIEKKNGYLRTREPLAPRDFALMCFPEKGKYPYKIFGLQKFPKGFAGVIEVK